MFKSFIGGLINVVRWESAQMTFLKPQMVVYRFIIPLIFNPFSLFSNIDPAQFMPSDPVSNTHNINRSIWPSPQLWIMNLVWMYAFTLFCSLLHAGRLYMQSSMRAMKRNSFAESSSSSLGMWVSWLSLLLQECFSFNHVVTQCSWVSVGTSMFTLLNICHVGHGSEPIWADEHPEQNHFKTWDIFVSAIFGVSLSHISLCNSCYSFWSAEIPSDNIFTFLCMLKRYRTWWVTLFLYYRWRSEDRWFQHWVLQEHGGSHGCILSFISRLLLVG